MLNRFQSFAVRQYATALAWDREFQTNIKSAKWSRNGKAGISWRGIRLLKDPFTLSLYTSLIWELKPRTIIEIGSFEGGSALWFADIAAALGIDTHVISYDLDPSQVRTSDLRIEFRQLDVFSISEQIDRATIRSLPHPFLVVEDAHKNLYSVLSFLYSLMEIGDYLVVEDTCDKDKHREFAQFMSSVENSLLVDVRYTDNFGYNASWNWNSFLRCMISPAYGVQPNIPSKELLGI